jgi:hypothetical protein
MQIEMPAKGAMQVVTLEVGLALLTLDETAGQPSTEPFKQRFNHVFLWILTSSHAHSLTSAWLKT